MTPHTFMVTVVTNTDEQAQEVLRKRLAPAKILGDPNDPATMPFPYIVDWHGQDDVEIDL